MKSSFATVFFAGLVAHSYAGVYITNPTESTSAQGGGSFQIQWQDDNKPPSLAEIGPCEVGIYSGSMRQQTELQPLTPSLDVSTQLSLNFTINPSIGPNSNEYFIRMTSLAAKDPTNPQFPYQTFSSKFTLSGMGGTFSPAVQAQIDGTSGAANPAAPYSPVSSPAPVATPGGIATTILQDNRPSTGAGSPTGSPTGSAPQATNTNAALTTRGNIGLLAVFVALVGLML